MLIHLGRSRTEQGEAVQALPLCRRRWSATGKRVTAGIWPRHSKQSRPRRRVSEKRSGLQDYGERPGHCAMCSARLYRHPIGRVSRLKRLQRATDWEAGFSAAMEQGRALSLEEAVAEASAIGSTSGIGVTSVREITDIDFAAEMVEAGLTAREARSAAFDRRGALERGDCQLYISPQPRRTSAAS